MGILNTILAGERIDQQSDAPPATSWSPSGEPATAPQSHGDAFEAPWSPSDALEPPDAPAAVCMACGSAAAWTDARGRLWCACDPPPVSACAICWWVLADEPEPHWESAVVAANLARRKRDGSFDRLAKIRGEHNYDHDRPWDDWRGPRPGESWEEWWGRLPGPELIFDRGKP